MSGERVPFYKSAAGISHYWRDNGDDTYSIESVSDVEQILDRNKAMATHNDGWAPSRDMRRAASIPMILVYKWLNEEGWWAFDPGCEDKLVQKLNDPDYLWLRTAPGRI